MEQEMKSGHSYGQEKGDICRRESCTGVIDEYERQACSCHINPPCWSCTEPRAYCPECDWHEKDDFTQHMNGFIIKTDSKTQNFNSWKRRELDATKIDYHILAHTNSSQKCVGVYPEGTTKDEILAQVKGTFGGRFEQLGGGKFTYIAYTD